MMVERTITRTIVPALPGWHVAILIKAAKDGTEPASLALDPIIAWEITRTEQPYHPSVSRPGETCVTHDVIPLTIDGNREHCVNRWAIKRPDGKFEIPEYYTCENEQETIAALSDPAAEAA
jgi:hypothetical protein